MLYTYPPGEFSVFLGVTQTDKINPEASNRAHDLCYSSLHQYISILLGEFVQVELMNIHWYSTAFR